MMIACIQKNKRITYILATYPKLSTTFVDREILAMRSMGAEIKIFALQPPTGSISGYQEDLRQETTYLYPIRWTTRLAAHAFFALTRPRRYFSTLFSLLTCSHPTFLSHRRTLLQFLQGIYATYLLRNDPGDHLHAHFLHQSATITLIISRMLDIPYSITVHASGELFANPFLVAEKLNDAKFIATCTEYNRDYLSKLSANLIDEKLIVNYHCLDAGQYQRRQSMPSDRPVILSVGQLMERKGFIYLIRACRILKERKASFHCRIIGEGPLRSLLEVEIARLGLAEEVQLVGALPQEEIIHQYEQANIFALPAVMAENGDRDGIPNVVLEAMAMELPVISTWHSGLPEVIHDQENGLLVPPQDPLLLANALFSLIEDREMAQALGARGRQTVLEKFDPQRNVKQLMAAFMA